MFQYIYELKYVWKPTLLSFIFWSFKFIIVFVYIGISCMDMKKTLRLSVIEYNLFA